MTSADMNADRASWVRSAVEHFAAETGAELYAEAIGDLICDIGHLCDRQDIDFLDLAAKSIGVWRIEQTDPVGVATAPVVTISFQASRPVSLAAPIQPSPTTKSGHRRYCVSVMMADYYSAWIEATSEADALDRAEHLWSEDTGAFHFDCSERQSIDVVDWEEVA